MGRKRKGKKVTVQKRVYKIPKFFLCPFCEEKDAVKITIKKQEGTADLTCMKCGRGDSNIKVGPLDEPIDIYNRYLDLSREVNQQYNTTVVSRDDSRNYQNNMYDDEEIEQDGTGLMRLKEKVQDASDSDYTELESDSNSN